MARRRSINQENVPELVGRYRAGAKLRELAEWLEGLGCKVSLETVRTELAKAVQAAEQRPERALSDAEPECWAERLRALRYELAQERAEARKGRRTDWKRYHGALRLTLALAKLENRAPASPAAPAALDQSASSATFFVLSDTGRRELLTSSSAER